MAFLLKIGHSGLVPESSDLGKPLDSGFRRSDGTEACPRLERGPSANPLKKGYGGSGAGHARQSRADFAVQHQVGDGVEVSRLAVENHQAGAAPLGEGGKTSGGIDNQGRADGHEQVAGVGFRLGARHLRLRHGLAERDRGGLDVAAAVAIRRLAVPLEPLPDGVELIALPAAETMSVRRVAVQLDDLLVRHPGRLVQPVDVLGDDARCLPLSHQPGDGGVPRRWAGRC